MATRFCQLGSWQQQYRCRRWMHLYERQQLLGQPAPLSVGLDRIHHHQQLRHRHSIDAHSRTVLLGPSMTSWAPYGLDYRRRTDPLSILYQFDQYRLPDSSVSVRWLSTDKRPPEDNKKTSASTGQQSDDNKSLTSEEKNETNLEEPEKRTIIKRIWDELVHYYHGFRLLGVEIRIAARLALKSSRGEDLTRREYRQLTRTMADIFRLVPFTVLIILPFMELLIPVIVRFFPGFLPSTFETAKDRESRIKAKLKLKLDMTKFLQQTLDEMALKAPGESHSHNAKKFAQFFEKIRKTGEVVKTEDILKFSKLFEDELTLDSLTRPQLTALCRLLELKPIGPDAILRFQLRTQLRRLMADDRMIKKEGINSLTVPELQQACRARGMRALGVAEDRLRQQLAQWLEMSLNEQIPPSLLLLSRILYLPENLPKSEQLKATLQALPVEAATEARYKIGETEGRVDNRTKLELIKQEEEAIKKEKEQAERLKKEELEQDRAAETLIDKATELLNEKIEKKDAAIGKLEEDKDKKEFSKEDMQSLEDALEQIEAEKKSLIIEKEELEDIKEDMEEYKEDIAEFKHLANGEKELLSAEKDRPKESKAARNLRKKVEQMVQNMDKVLGGLAPDGGVQDKQGRSEAEILRDTIVDDVIKTPRQLDFDDYDVKMREDELERAKKLVNINELILALRQVSGSEDKVQKIVDVLDLLDVDNDGNVEIELVMKVIEFLTREDVKVTKEQVQDIARLFQEETELERDEKKSKKEQKESNSSSTTNGSSDPKLPKS